MEEDDNNLFLNRILNSNVFLKDEINVIKSNFYLYEKCYLLGILDAQK